MSDHLDRIRQIALLLPGVAEAADGSTQRFMVEGTPFATFGPDGLSLRQGDDWPAVPLDGDIDWTLVEDRIARAWELSAPRALLEAGGR